MADQDPFDTVLRESIGGGGVPALSPEFDRRLARRLRPRRLSAAGRVVLALYAVAALRGHVSKKEREEIQQILNGETGRKE